MRKYDYVFTDADNTLFDFDKAEKVALKALLLKYYIPFSDDLLINYRKHNVILWEKIEKGEFTKKDLFANRFIMFKGMGKLDYDNDVEQMNLFYTKELSKCAFLLDGAKELLDELKNNGFKLYMVTNGLKVVQDSRFEASGILPYFDGIYISEEVGFQKPSKEYFDYVFKDASINDKSKCIILGDSLTSDMQGGRNAGIATCKLNLNGKSTVKSDLCDYEIDKLSDFLNIVLQK